MRSPKRTTAHGYRGSSPLLRRLARDEKLLQACQSVMELAFAGQFLNELTTSADAGEAFKIVHSLFQRGIMPVAALPLEELDKFFAPAVERIGLDMTVENVRRTLAMETLTEEWQAFMQKASGGRRD